MKQPNGFARQIAPALLFWGLVAGCATPESSDDAGGTGGAATGGTVGTGGTPATGGTVGTGGTSSGGHVGSGGAAGAPAASGGRGGGSGGTIATGGSVGSGGVQATGGNASGGTPGTGGAAPGGAAGSGHVGTGGSGMAGAAGGSNGTGGAGGSASPCNVQPIDPQATIQAKRLLCYLYAQYGNHVLSGQQEQSWASDPDIDNQYIQQTTGKLPAVRGLDFLYQSTDSKGRTTTSRAQDWWNGGGIAQLIYHMGNPTGDDSYDSAKKSCGSGCINDTLTSGTSKNQVFMSRLNHAVTELAKLQSANVAVIWRPWHESNGGWFWWGMEGGGQFVKLYKFTKDYFINTKGIHNVVWEVSWAQNNPDKSWDPGPGTYDVAGPDTYASNSPFSGQYQAAKSIVGGSIPISLQENGLMPDPSAMFSNSQAPWLFFNTWTQFEYAPGNQYGANPVDHTKAVYSDSHTVNHDGIPNLR